MRDKNSVARRAATKRWNDAHMSEYDRLTILIPRNDKEFKKRIKEACCGESMSAFLYNLISKELDKLGV